MSKRSGIWHIEDMREVWDASFALPTVVFTVMLGIVGCLWIISLLGVIDLEIDAAEHLLRVPEALAEIAHAK